MALSEKTPIAAIMAELTEKVDLLIEEVGEELARAGELGVNAARLNGSYKDQTGNLRSSVGYVVARNGEVWTSGEFAKVIGEKNKTRQVVGDKVGKNIASEYAKTLSNDGYALVMVAGMEYASFVSDRGYDVLDSGELAVRKQLDTRFKQLGFDVKATEYKE